MRNDIAIPRIGILAVVVAGLCACSTGVPLYSPLASQTAPVFLTRVEPANDMPTLAAISPTDVVFAMPARGPAITLFEAHTHPGIDIAGHPGDPILASRGGRVVLVSSALPAYGTMIVLKHDVTFLTAYAHLGRTLVHEEDEVSQGRQIAELGSRGNGHDALHFEIRKIGVPVDPELYVEGISH